MAYNYLLKTLNARVQYNRMECIPRERIRDSYDFMEGSGDVAARIIQTFPNSKFKAHSKD